MALAAASSGGWGCGHSVAPTPSGVVTAPPAAEGGATPLASMAQGASLSQAAAAPSALAARAPARKGPPKGLNVLLVTVDSLRADMPWTGYARPIAPRMTELAKRAVVYTRAYAVSSYTSMSLGALLAARYPSELVRDGYFFGTYPKENLMFPEVLKDKSVATFGAHAHGYFKTAGFDQGFARWEIVPNLKWNNTTDENITAPELMKLAEKQLADPALDKQRFFGWYHFMDPHDKYLPHPGVGPYGKSLRDRYDAEVTFTDDYVGKLVDLVRSKPWGDRTVLILSADHGEAFGEHNHYAHGFELWEPLVRVPLLFVAPDAAPRTVETPRSHIDLGRTILELLEVEAPKEFRGKSLVGELYGAEAEARDVFIDLPPTSDNDRRRAVVAGNKKVISFGAQGLKRVFDVVADPAEATPLKRDDMGDALQRFKAMDDAVKEIPPTKCKEGCLNGAYLKKDGGA